MASVASPQLPTLGGCQGLRPLPPSQKPLVLDRFGLGWVLSLGIMGVTPLSLTAPLLFVDAPFTPTGPSARQFLFFLPIPWLCCPAQSHFPGPPPLAPRLSLLFSSCRDRWHLALRP